MLSEINVLDFQAELGGHSHSIISQHYPFSFSRSLSELPTGTQQIENSMHRRAHAAQFYSLLEPPSFPCGPLFFFFLLFANKLCLCPTGLQAKGTGTPTNMKKQ